MQKTLFVTPNNLEELNEYLSNGWTVINTCQVSEHVSVSVSSVSYPKETIRGAFGAFFTIQKNKIIE
jgi:hypothetical protein